MVMTVHGAAPASAGGGKYMMIDSGVIVAGGFFESDIYTNLEWVRSGFIEAHNQILTYVIMDFGTLVDGEPSFSTGAFPGGLEVCDGTSDTSIIKFGPLGQCARWTVNNHIGSPINIRIWLFGIESTEATPEVLP